MDSSVIAPITPVYFVIRVKLEHVHPPMIYKFLWELNFSPQRLTKNGTQL